MLRIGLGFLSLGLAVAPLVVAADSPEEAGLATQPVKTASVLPAAPEENSSDAVPRRLLGVIPNFRAEQQQPTYTPLTISEKFAIARRDSFDWPNYFLLIGYSLQSQMADRKNNYRGGELNRFGTFYSRSLADQITSNYLTEAILPSLLREDPRFFRLGTGPVWSRALYAASRVFVTKKDNGTTGFANSEVLGNLGITIFSNLYHTDNRSVWATSQRYGLALGNDIVSNLLTEFWPDIKHHLPFRHR